MATSTFERKIEIRDPQAIRHLYQIDAAPASKLPLSSHPFTEEEQKRSEALLTQFLSH